MSIQIVATAAAATIAGVGAVGYGIYRMVSKKGSEETSNEETPQAEETSTEESTVVDFPHVSAYTKAVVNADYLISENDGETFTLKGDGWATADVAPDGSMVVYVLQTDPDNPAYTVNVYSKTAAIKTMEDGTRAITFQKGDGLQIDDRGLTIDIR